MSEQTKIIIFTMFLFTVYKCIIYLYKYLDFNIVYAHTHTHTKLYHFIMYQWVQL